MAKNKYVPWNLSYVPCIGSIVRNKIYPTIWRVYWLHYFDVTWALSRLKSPATQMFIQQHIDYNFNGKPVWVLSKLEN